MAVRDFAETRGETMTAFQPTEEVTRKVDAVYALLAGLSRGQVLGHEAIQEVLGVPPHTGSWSWVMRKARRRLEDEKGVAVWPDYTVGYRLCTVAEQLQLPGRRLRRAVRQVRRGRRSVEALPFRGLTPHQRRSQLFLAERSLDVERSLQRELRTQAESLRSTPTVPRRPQAAGGG
jgi:hypothetical protein